MKGLSESRQKALKIVFFINLFRKIDTKLELTLKKKEMTKPSVSLSVCSIARPYNIESTNCM